MSSSHPLVALRDPQIWEALKPVVELYKQLAAKQLQSYVKPGICNNEHDDFDINDYVRAGVHCVPSLDNLHVHIISADMSSPSMKNARHYNSFNTAFFLDFDEIPTLTDSDFRLDPVLIEYRAKTAPLVCWKCRVSYGRHFTSLKAHLLEECDKIFESKQ